jgi:RNA polymerase sigma factor (sigma-70 family)
MVPDPAAGVEGKVESQQSLIWIQHFLWTLPEIDRAAFILRVQHELPYVEIARVLECSAGAARVKVHRVRKKLIEMSFEKEDGGR